MPTDTANARRSKNARGDGAACARDHETDAGDSTKTVHEEEEIEVTEEMIKAGADVLMLFETYTTDESYWAEKVYLAMRCAERKG
jgi:hypothetical protein